MNTQPNPLRMLAALVIDFFRWSQLTPMILMWAMMLALLLGLLVIGNQDATWTLIGRVTEWVASLPWVGPRFVAWMDAQAEDGVIHLSGPNIDFKTAALAAWGVISVIFMILAWVAGRFFGPFKPWTLKRKLGWTALACLLVVLAFVLLYFIDKESWNDPLSKVLFTTSAMSIILFIVSAWCLTISHVLFWLSDAVAKGDFGKLQSGDGAL